jgi:hypothetical protein
MGSAFTALSTLWNSSVQAMSSTSHTIHDEVVTWLTSHATEGVTKIQAFAQELLTVRINEIRAAKAAVTALKAAEHHKAPQSLAKVSNFTGVSLKVNLSLTIVTLSGPVKSNRERKGTPFVGRQRRPRKVKADGIHKAQLRLTAVTKPMLDKSHTAQTGTPFVVSQGRPSRVKAHGIHKAKLSLTIVTLPWPVKSDTGRCQRRPLQVKADGSYKA